DTKSGQETLTLKGHTYGIPSVTFSPDGQLLASVGYDRTLRVWDARPWSPQLRVEQQARNLISVLYASLGVKADIIKSIREDLTLRNEVRQEALAMTRQWQEDSQLLNLASWNVVVSPNAAPESYARALRQAQTACQIEPANGYCLNTLGVALLRNGRFQ